MTWPSGQANCPFLILCMVSMPVMTSTADQNDLNPSIGLTPSLDASMALPDAVVQVLRLPRFDARTTVFD